MINGELLLWVPVDKNHKTQKYKRPTSKPSEWQHRLFSTVAYPMWMEIVMKSMKTFSINPSDNLSSLSKKLLLQKSNPFRKFFQVLSINYFFKLSAIIPSYYNLLSNAVHSSFLMVTPFKLILLFSSSVTFSLFAQFVLLFIHLIGLFECLLCDKF